MSESTRHSQAAEAELIQDPETLAGQESYNVVQQCRYGEELSARGAAFQAAALPSGPPVTRFYWSS